MLRLKGGINILLEASVLAAKKSKTGQYKNEILQTSQINFHRTQDRFLYFMYLIINTSDSFISSSGWQSDL